MTPSEAASEPAAGTARLLRFDRAERWAHRALALLMLVCLATAVALYLPSASARIGHREVVSTAHVAAGLLLPVPLLAALASRAYRRDLSLLNRFSPDDWAWLRSSDRRSGRIRVGKFNAGQKLNAAFTAGAIAVMLLTGSVMRLGASPDDWKTGATFVHDWLALAVVVVVAGHAVMAYHDPVARLGMRTGLVPEWWAAREHAAWLARQGQETADRPPR
jgi:formate dehydrogenase subunit gamma